MSPAHETGRSLSDGWRMLVTEAGRHAKPDEAKAAPGAIAAPVPGTAAAALEAAGSFDRAAPMPLHDKDIWYFHHLPEEETGKAVLRFEGLATVADVYLNGEPVLHCQSMFERHDVPVTLAGGDELTIRFHALTPFLEAAGPRARWRPQMMDWQGLRLLRATLLGHMPGWCPSVHAVGPWRPVRLLRPDALPLTGLRIRSSLTEAGEGLLSVSFRTDAAREGLCLSCGGCEIALARDGEGNWQGELAIAAVEPWWPLTHGKPRLYDIELVAGSERHHIGRTGFRRIAIDRGADGRDFSLSVNGADVFCRGAVWTNADIVRLPGDRESYRPWLELAAEAGMNMIRIGGTMAYESRAFFDLCDELGLMVWQDFMFANFDYPVKDEAFCAHVTAEAGQLLADLQGCPSLAVLCGGSEIAQQAAMMGLPERFWTSALTGEILPALCADLRPDAVYVENSPVGGALPFSADTGVAHYYGVGAYCRPLEDARRANVRFAAESLAFANVPQQATLARHLDVPPAHHPDWKARVPRDRSASWDFEDIRDHYLGLLYGMDPARLRREDAARYLDISRAVTGEVMEVTFAEWRRSGSSCHGALVWTLQDLLPGPGWGVIDATGLPKPCWHALKRAFRPVQVLLTDEGVNGLDVHVLNETGGELSVTLELACLRDGRQAVVSGRRDLLLKARESVKIAATALFGAFFDTAYAYRFGPPAHDVTIARLTGAQGDYLADAFHFPMGRSAALHDAGIEVSLRREEAGWSLDLSADRFAQSVHIDAAGYRPEDDGFHLAPANRRVIRLHPLPGTDIDALPSGEVTQLGGKRVTRF